MSYSKVTESGVQLFVRVKLRSSRTGPLGIRKSDQERLEWGVSSAPIDGAANAELIQSVARFLGISRSRVSLDSGEHSREKVLLIADLSEQQIRELLPGAE